MLQGRGGKWQLPTPFFPDMSPNTLWNQYRFPNCLLCKLSFLRCFSSGYCFFMGKDATITYPPWLLNLQAPSPTCYTNSQNSTPLIFKARNNGAMFYLCGLPGIAPLHDHNYLLPMGSSWPPFPALPNLPSLNVASPLHLVVGFFLSVFTLWLSDLDVSVILL